VKEQGLLGASYLGDGRCRFLVWAAIAERGNVHITASAVLFVKEK
jgi:hypothetical protein